MRWKSKDLNLKQGDNIALKIQKHQNMTQTNHRYKMTSIPQEVTKFRQKKNNKEY